MAGFPSLALGLVKLAADRGRVAGATWSGAERDLPRECPGPRRSPGLPQHAARSQPWSGDRITPPARRASEGRARDTPADPLSVVLDHGAGSVSDGRGPYPTSAWRCSRTVAHAPAGGQVSPPVVCDHDALPPDDLAVAVAIASRTDLTTGDTGYTEVRESIGNEFTSMKSDVSSISGPSSPPLCHCVPCGEVVFPRSDAGGRRTPPRPQDARQPWPAAGTGARRPSVTYEWLPSVRLCVSSMTRLSRCSSAASSSSLGRWSL